MLRPQTIYQLPTVLQQIIADFPEVDFKIGQKFTFRPPNTVFIHPKDPDILLLTLHELGHFLSHHTSYKTCLKLLKLETEAWQRAKPLATKYHIKYDESIIQRHLDTYRDHIYSNIVCPNCKNYCLETKSGKLFCPYCSSFVVKTSDK